MRKLKMIGVMCLIVLMIFSASIVFGESKKDEGRKTIVLLMLGMESPYCPPYVSNFSEIVSAAGINFFMFNAKFDAQLQSTQMDDAIAMRPDMIVLFAADSQGLAPGIKKAYDAGIPVFMCNNPPVKESEQYTVAYAGPNNYLEGQVEVMHIMNTAQYYDEFSDAYVKEYGSIIQAAMFAPEPVDRRG